MDSVASALVVDHIRQTITLLLANLSETINQAPATPQPEVQGLREVLLQSQSLWKQWGLQYCLFDQGSRVHDFDVVRFQELINQSRLLCGAIRNQKPLNTTFASSLESGHIGELVFQGETVRRFRSVASEQIRVLNDLRSVFEQRMSKVEAAPVPIELAVRKSVETERTLVNLPTSSSTSSLFSRLRSWIPEMKLHSQQPSCIKTSRKIPSQPETSISIIPREVCNCRSCIAEAERTSKEIDLQLKQDAELAKNKRTIVLLGHRESTDQITKLLLRFDKAPYTAEELQQKTELVRRRAYEDVVRQFFLWDPRSPFRPDSTKGQAVKHDDEEEVYRFRDEIEGNETPTLTLQQAITFQEIWARHWRRQGTEIPDLYHFLNNIKRIVSPSFIPTETDVFHIPLPYCGLRLLPTIFHKPHSPLELNIAQYHGTDRRFLQYLNDTSAVLFPLDLTLYSETDMDIGSRGDYSPTSWNTIQQGLSIFPSIANSRLFEGRPIFLWLGNVQKFKTMVTEEKEDMSQYVLDCDAGKDGEKAVQLIVEKFLSGARHRKNVFVSFLDVLDVDQVRKAVGEMADILPRWPENNDAGKRRDTRALKK